MFKRFRSGQSQSDSTDASGQDLESVTSGAIINVGGAMPLPPPNAHGLTLVHDPHKSRATADVIFVHGLGGNSWTTWCWKHDPSMFWPAWLQHEHGVSHFRVFTFGYNANWRGPDTKLSLLDFAKSLLVQMRGYGDPEPDGKWPIGKRPIIFVAHSMGGLVVKKAYILGKYDEHYADMISHVHGVIFLSTPHRGSSHASSLNKILSVTVGTSKKVYVTELESNSTSIEDINEQFRSVGKALRLASMYETLSTRMFPGIKKLIVGKDTGILNYPGEISGPANANHHTICKYRNRDDENYILFIAFLKQLSQDLVPPRTVPRPPQEPVHTLESILGIVENPAEDLGKFASQGLQGSGEWLRRRKSFEQWLSDPSEDTRLFCLTGMPGSGKSTLAAMTIRHLQEVFLGQSCQYHFFTESQPTKRSLAYCLRSIAFQIATTHDVFTERLVRLHQDVGDELSSQKYQTIWAKVFQGILFKIDIGCRLHWVFDAVDEAEDPRVLLNLVSQTNSSSGIKIMLLSRPNKDILETVEHRAKRAIFDTIATGDTAQDIGEYVRSVVTATVPKESLVQAQIIDQIVSRTEGSFLWAHLALDTLHHNWHTMGDMQKAMETIPQDMQSLYRRMLSTVRSQSQRLQDMAQLILSWATCSFRPMKLAEVQAALEPEFGEFTSLKDTVIQLCGHFVRLDGENISLIHATARVFLTTPDGDEPVFIPWQDSHEMLAKACLRYLCHDRWRQILSRIPEADAMYKDRLAVLYDTHPFLSYALNYWAYHVRHSSATSPALLEHLKIFFSKHVLCWIQAVALSRSLRTLPLASQYIKLYLRKLNRAHPPSLTAASPTGDISGGFKVPFLERWVVDLVRLLGQFGNNLVENPSSVFKHIPPFCPRNSIIGQFALPQNNALIHIAGLHSRLWGDNIARLSVGYDETASKVRCTGVYFLTLISNNGTVIVWSAETCEELRRFEHGEWVTLLETNTTGSTAATSGRLSFKIWNISSGQLLHTITRDPELRPVQIAFGDVEAQFVVGYDNCLVVWYDVQTGAEVRRFTTEQSDKLRGCPRLTSLSPDQSRVAIAFPGQPVTVWETNDASLAPPRQCLRAVDGTRSSASDPYSISEVAVWHPNGESLYIVYFDMVLVHWDVAKDETTEFEHTVARDMVINSDGTLLLTANFSGVLSVWALPRFNLVYRLHGNDLLRDMAFSPDSQRIYNTTGSLCCVWEPDALVRPDSIDRHEDGKNNSGDDSLVSEAVPEPMYSENTTGTHVSALTYERGGEFYCCGREDGTVSIHNLKNGKIARKVCDHGLRADVVSLGWSPSGKFLASGDDMGKVIVKKLRIKEDEKWAVYPVFETKIADGFADQFVFSRDEHFLLISAPLHYQVWDLGTKSKIWATSREEEQSGYWINHPFDETRLLLMEQSQIHIHEWQDPNNKLLHSIVTTTAADDDDIKAPQLMSTTSSGTAWVQALAETNNQEYLVCQTPSEDGKTPFKNKKAKVFLSLLQATDLRGPTSMPQEQIRCQPLFGLSTYVQRFLGCHRGKFVFIDHGNWLCTSDVVWGEDMPLNLRKHFFLPRDWMGTASAVQLITFTEQGVLLVPRNGEVTIVRYAKGF